MERIKLRVMVAALAVLCVAADAGLATASTVRHRVAVHRAGVEGRSYYVDFLARPAGYVGHSFVQAGALDAHGGRHPAMTVGLYPANPDRIFDAPGKVTALALDLKPDPGVRYRVLVSERTYLKMLALMKILPDTWRRYDLVQNNCNNMVADVARHLGLVAPGDTADLPTNYVRSLAEVNGGRTRASWR